MANDSDITLPVLQLNATTADTDGDDDIILVGENLGLCLLSSSYLDLGQTFSYSIWYRSHVDTGRHQTVSWPLCAESTL